MAEGTLCVCYEGREVTPGKLALQARSAEVDLSPCRPAALMHLCCTVTHMSPALPGLLH